jgi:hypothetical protein
MERKELEVYSEVVNFGIVRMPGREFPACAIPGDSLCILFHRALDVFERLKTMQGDQELIDDATELVELLSGRLDHFETVVTEHGFRLPYLRRPLR